MQKINKTNVARLLDKAKIAYELVPYVVDENDLSATHVAAQLNEPVERVFKTLVLNGNKTGHFVCVIPADKEVDLKKAAKVSGNKNCELIHVKDLMQVTGYIRGGCSPVGMKRQLPTYFHSSFIDYDYVYVSAGQRGLQVKLAPDALRSYVNGEIDDLVGE